MWLFLVARILTRKLSYIIIIITIIIKLPGFWSASELH
jgi:hypothetical protein